MKQYHISRRLSSLASIVALIFTVSVMQFSHHGLQPYQLVIILVILMAASTAVAVKRPGLSAIVLSAGSLLLATSGYVRTILFH